MKQTCGISGPLLLTPLPFQHHTEVQKTSSASGTGPGPGPYPLQPYPGHPLPLEWMWTSCPVLPLSCSPHLILHPLDLHQVVPPELCFHLRLLRLVIICEGLPKVWLHPGTEEEDGVVPTCLIHSFMNLIQHNLLLTLLFLWESHFTWVNLAATSGMRFQLLQLYPIIILPLH